MKQKELIRCCFDSSANTYDSVAEIQTLSSRCLVSLLDIENVSSILDVGCGTGNTSLELLKRYPNAEFTLLDISPNMLDVASKKFPKSVDTICCDAESYEFDKSYDLVISNLSVQWFSSLPKFIEKIKKHCCTFAFSTLINTSFERYKDLFQLPPTFDYPSSEKLLSEISNLSTYKIERYTLELENFFAVTRYFKKLGAYLKSNDNSCLKNSGNEKIFLDYDVFFAVLKTAQP